jgi:hypothetical protein
MTCTISQRVAQLEKVTPSREPAGTWVQICVHAGESQEEVMARYLAEHPEMPAPTHWIVLQGVLPPAR